MYPAIKLFHKHIWIMKTNIGACVHIVWTLFLVYLYIH